MRRNRLNRTEAAEVGRRVKAELQRQKVRQWAAAATLGMSQQALSARLAGAVALDVEELGKLSDLLHVPVADLVSDAA